MARQSHLRREPSSARPSSRWPGLLALLAIGLLALQAAPVARADTAAPQVTLSLEQGSHAGWYNAGDGPVTGTVVATSPAGVAAISCTNGDAGPLTPVDATTASATVTVTGTGVATVTCTATDAATPPTSGAAPGSANSVTVRIDKTPPSVSISHARVGPVGTGLGGSRSFFDLAGPFSGEGSLSDGVATQQTYVLGYTALEDLSRPQLVFVNQYFSNFIEKPGPNPIFVGATIEYPIGSATEQPTFHRLTAAGATDWAVPPGERVTTDPASSVHIPAGSAYRIRVYVHVKNAGEKWPVATPPMAGNGLSPQEPARKEGSYEGDLLTTNLGWTYSRANPYAPQEILAPTSKTSVAIFGDSIAHGYDNTAHGGGYYGGIVGALDGHVGYVSIATDSETAANFAKSSFATLRMASLGGAQYAVGMIGRNDLTSNDRTVPEMQRDLLTIWQRFADRGIKVYACTILPRTDSTDSWATTANQTVHPSEAKRVELNDWIRAGAPIDPVTKLPVAVGTAGALVSGAPDHPLTGYFDTADALETSRNSGLWKVDGTPSKYVEAGVHPTAAGYKLMAAAIDPAEFTPVATDPAVSASDGDSGLAGAPACTDSLNGASAGTAALGGTGSPWAIPLTGEGTHAITCDATDVAGNVASTAVDTVDRSPPSTTGDAPAGARNADVTVTLAASDADDPASGLVTHYRVDGANDHAGHTVTIPAPSDHSGDGAHTIRYFSVDPAGNSEGPHSSTVTIDTVPPTITATATTADSNPYVPGTFTKQPVTVHYSCSDAGGSGVRSCPADETIDGATASLSATAEDEAGNTATTHFGPVQVDSTPPDLTLSHAGTTETAVARDDGSGLPAAPVCSDSLAFVPPWLVPDPHIAGRWSFAVSGEGAHAIACDTSDLAGNAAATATDTVEVDQTPPALSISHQGRSVTVTATDERSGIATPPACTDALDSGAPVAVSLSGPAPWTFQLSGDGSHALTCDISDRAGNAATTATQTVQVDTTAPQLTVSHSGATASVLARDGGSGLAAVPVCSDSLGLVPPLLVPDVAVAGKWSFLVTGDGRHAIACDVSDLAGNAAVTATDTVEIDTTPPSVTCDSADAAWHKDNIAIACRASETGSGLAHAEEGDFSLSTAVADGSADGNASTSAHPAICDRAGNCSPTPTIRGIKVDRAAPTVTLSGCPAKPLASTDTAPSLSVSARDADSGLATDPSGAATLPLSPGRQRARFTATDVAGNSASGYCNYIVVRAPMTPWVSGLASAPGLLAYWRLGEAGGTLAHDGLGGLDGTFDGARLGATGALSGDPDTAAQFDGTGARVSLPALPDSVDFAVEGWQKISTSGVTPSNGNNTLFGGGGLRLMPRPAGYYAGVTLGGSEYRLEGGTASNAAVWVHWALTRSGPDLALYRNGVQVAARHDLPATTPAHVTGAAIGRQGNANAANAAIDDVALYDKALTASQVAAQLAAAGPPAPVFTTPYPSAVAAAPGLLAFWRLGDASATTARDALGLSDGTYSASGVSVGVVGAMAADPDPAARFDGTGGQIAVPAPPDSLDFTVEGWQRISTSGATPTNGNNTLFGGAGLRLMPRPAGYYAGVTLGGSEYRLEGASASNVGVWAHWALTRTGADLALYRNGVQVAARHDLPAATPTHITGAAIGRQSNSNSANATIDDVALYGKALTAAQVAAQLAAAGPVSPTFTTPYPSAVAATPGLLGYWRLGDASATTARDALGLADGAYSATGVSVGAGGALAADSDAAARFDGSGGQVTVPAPPDSTDLTVEGWEKVSTVGLTPSNGNNTLFGGGGLRLLVRPAGFYAGVTLGGSEYRLEGASASNVGVWAHWALTRTGPDLALYRNGVQVAARHDLPAGTPTHVTGAAIGRQSNSNSANASIDEVAVYSKALTSTQIAAHNAAGR